MSYQRNLQKIKLILAKELSHDIDKITEASIITSDLGADSLDIAEITLIVKEQFDYDFNDAELNSIKTVGDMCRILTDEIKEDVA
jgi:acyl carrier protein